MILQLKADGRCSGKYADELWPRADHLGDGQKGLVTALVKTEVFLVDWNAPPAPAPVGLEAWLLHKDTKVKTVHKVELKRRGLKQRGNKIVLSLLIRNHVASNLRGYKDEKGVFRVAAPEGYSGELPPAMGGTTDAPADCAGGADPAVDPGPMHEATEGTPADGAGGAAP